MSKEIDFERPYFEFVGVEAHSDRVGEGEADASDSPSITMKISKHVQEFADKVQFAGQAATYWLDPIEKIYSMAEATSGLISMSASLGSPESKETFVITRDLLKALSRAIAELTKLFPEDTIDVFVDDDPEMGDDQLFLDVITSLPVEEALSRRNEFEENWLFAVDNQYGRMINVSVRFE